MKSDLVWIDLEMTGLDPEKEVILEIATIMTDDRLEVVAEGPNISINYPDEILENMDEWNSTHHKASGLLERVNTSTHDCRMAEKETLEFISGYCKKGEPLLCGNSVWQDRRFLIKHMSELEEFFHYRIIDVSSIKELAKRWYPSLTAYEKKNAHLALSDIKESISELKYYREKVFLPSTG
ncbi:MAG: oligoribonuclease [Desulfobacteraceae bacterium]|nr:oligoribonuclease [Desulfobacteraceae bacterium]